jgi:hypothetical protein
MTGRQLVVGARILLAVSAPLLVVAVGVVSVVHAPPSVEESFEPWVRCSWSAALIIGGLLSLSSLYTGSTRSRASSMALVAGGAGFYALTLLGSGWDALAASGLLGAFALATLAHLLTLTDIAAVRRDAARRRHPAGRGGPG